ncbi:MAG: lamin tail domain-containing protein, partial [candidate division WOR-3 bacterium]
MNRHFHWLILLLVCHPLFANPIIVTYINEVQANPPSLQRIELHEIPEESSTTLNLSGYQIKTRAGVAIINSGVVLPAGGYVTIDATNTSGVFQINPICDTIVFRYNANSILDQVSWPHQPAGWQKAPTPPLNGSI